MPYIGNPIYQSAFVTDQFSGNGSTTAFTMSVSPAGVSNVLVAVSGVLQDPSTYGVVGTTLNFTTAPPPGTGNISVRYLGVPVTGVTTTAYRTVTEFTATAGQTTFTPPSYTVGFINVYLNGVLLGSADYTASNGTTVVLTTGAASGNLVTVESFLVSSVLNAISNTAGSISSSNLPANLTITTPTIDKINTSVTNTSLGAGNASIMKNRIINGAMVINQRATTISASSSGWQYAVDRWACYQNIASSKFTLQGSSTAPTGFTNSLLATSSSAYSIGASEFFTVRQPIEGFNTADLGWGTANAKTVTLSFQVYCSLTGTFAGFIQNANDGSRTYPFTYTVSSANTWTTISITIAGDTSGTWLTNNGAGPAVCFSMGCGSTYLGTANAWTGSTIFGVTGQTNLVATSGATWYITGVQLEVGSSATGYEYVNYQTSLANCQRYYEVVTIDGGITFTVGTNQFGSAGSIGNQYYKVTKRASPTVASSSTNNWYRYTVYNGSNASATPSFNNGNSILFSINFGSFPASSVHWVYNQNNDYVVTASAEL